MSGWNPALYSRFEDERTRPARELLARVPQLPVQHAVDLGCGPGNSTALIVERFPDAAVTGVDNDPAMLDSARQRLPNASFQLGDIGAWQPASPPDLLFANAALHWVPDHDALLPRLFAALAPGGVLAVQMPDNLAEPSHRLMRDVAGGRAADSPIALPRIAPERAYDLLVGSDAASVDVWHTVYRHPLASPRAIVDWLRSTGLKPFLDPLDDGGRAAFLADYEQRIAAAYPARADGMRLLAFPRWFLVAQRKP